MTYRPDHPLLAQIALALLGAAIGVFVQAAIKVWEIGLIPLAAGIIIGSIAFLGEPE